MHRSANEIKTYCWFGTQTTLQSSCDQCSVTLHSVKERTNGLKCWKGLFIRNVEVILFSWLTHVLLHRFQDLKLLATSVPFSVKTVIGDCSIEIEGNYVINLNIHLLQLSDGRYFQGRAFQYDISEIQND